MGGSSGIHIFVIGVGVVIILNTEPSPTQEWEVRLVRPDGNYYDKGWILEDVERPKLHTGYHNGVMYVESRYNRERVTAPKGWFIEVFKRKEKK